MTTGHRNGHAHGASLDVAVNLLWLAPGRVGGSEEYLVRQLLGLAAVDITPTLYVQPTFLDAHPDLVARLRTVAGPLPRDWRALRIAAEHTWLAQRTRRAGVVHHGGGTIPSGARRPTVLTVHDLQYLTYPQYFGPTRLAYLRATMPSSVRRATIVATPSQYVRERVVEAFGVDEERVVVVPHGVPDAPGPEPEAIAEVLQRHAVRAPYVVYPAITHPHKGHRVLIDFVRVTSAPNHPLHDVQLVLIGGAGPAETELLAAIAADGGVAERVVRTGRVPPADRDALIAGASALVFPSEYEGFGAPLVEAMTFGVPVVASDHPALVEVLGGAGIVVAERTGEAWAEAVTEALAQPDRLIVAGHARRTDFTVARSGEALVAAYRRAAA